MNAQGNKPGLLSRMREDIANAFEKTAERLRTRETHVDAEPRSELLPEPTIAGSLMNRFDSFWPSSLPPLRFPNVELENLDREIVARIDVPGFSEKDLDVDVTPTRLVVRGRARREKEDGSGAGYRRASWSSRFTRSVELPAEVETARVSAKTKDGLLIVKMLKTAIARSRRVKIAVS